MRVRADIVSEDAVGGKFLAQNVQSLMRREAFTGRAQRALKCVRCARKSSIDQWLVSAATSPDAAIARSRSHALFQSKFKLIAASAASLLMWRIGDPSSPTLRS